MSDSIPPTIPSLTENPYAAPLSAITGPSDISGAEAMRTAHINRETTVKSIGALHVLGGLFLVVLAVVGFVNPGNEHEPLSAALYGALGVGMLLSGLALRQLHPKALISGGLICGIGLLSFPIGTIINGCFLYSLLSEKGRFVLSPPYKEIISQTPHLKRRMSVVLRVLLIILLVFFIAAPLIMWALR